MGMGGSVGGLKCQCGFWLNHQFGHRDQFGPCCETPRHPRLLYLSQVVVSLPFSLVTEPVPAISGMLFNSRLRSVPACTGGTKGPEAETLEML